MELLCRTGQHVVEKGDTLSSWRAGFTKTSNGHFQVMSPLASGKDRQETLRVDRRLHLPFLKKRVSAASQCHINTSGSFRPA